MTTALWTVFIGVTLGNVCIFGLLFHSLWVRLRSYADALESIESHLPNKALMEIQAMFAGLKAEFDQTIIGNDSFRERVHKEINRTDQIMRRNEKAFRDRQTIAGSEEEEVDEEKYPDQVPLEKAMPDVDSANMTKQQRLRAQWRANRQRT